jgi:hypothetical protein
MKRSIRLQLGVGFKRLANKDFIVLGIIFFKITRALHVHNY